MVTALEPKAPMNSGVELAEQTFAKASTDPVQIDIVDLDSFIPQGRTTILHIYFEHECCHKFITPTPSVPQERRFGPKPKEQKARRIAKKAAKEQREASHGPPTCTTSDRSIAIADGSGPATVVTDHYFLHTPYLSFHIPPSVLYSGPDRCAPNIPTALIHTGCFWRSYKIQLGPSLAQPGVIDPRGVVSWRHNCGSKSALQDDERNGEGRLLKGYKIRGWRLWGESGKKFVHGIRHRRKTGEVFDDPDGDDVLGGADARRKVRADEVVYLTWTRPLSRHTRLYTFHFRGVEFQWKGTGTVHEGRKCGWMLRFCHLKLVTSAPVEIKGEGDAGREVCLAKYTSSIAAEKSGTLAVFDNVLLRFAEKRMPTLLGEEVPDEKRKDNGKLEEDMIAKLKQSMLYQLIVATALCMVSSEKQKRHTLMDLIIGILENGANGGG